MFGLKRITELLSVHELLEQFNSEFSPPLSTRIQSFDLYADKLVKYAFVFAAFSAGTPEAVGFCVIYANDQNTKKAYISQLGVKQEFQGLGVGKLLINEAIRIALDQGMKELGLEVRKDNDKAIQFYKHFLFNVYSDIDEQNYYMKRTL